MSRDLALSLAHEIFESVTEQLGILENPQGCRLSRDEIHDGVLDAIENADIDLKDNQE